MLAIRYVELRKENGSILGGVNNHLVFKQVIYRYVTLSCLLKTAITPIGEDSRLING